MEKKINIKIQSSQTDMIGDKENMEFFTEGLYRREEESGIQSIVYDESIVSGLEGVTSTVRIKDGEVTLMRDGDESSQMYFREDLKSEFIYKTPYGELPITTTTHEVKVNICEDADNQSEIYLRYTIQFADDPFSYLNEFTMRF